MVLNEKGKKVGVSVSYPPANLYHILFELFKNSMRATVETHHKAMSLPKIEVLLAKGEHDVSIRISDQVRSIQYFFSQTPHRDIVLKGGGIPRHITDATFHYLVSTAPRPSFDNPAKAPLAGYGRMMIEENNKNKLIIVYLVQGTVFPYPDCTLATSTAT